MEGFWPIFFLAVILKIPIAALLYLVWWAIHQTPETEEAPPDAEDHDFRHCRARAPAPARPAPRPPRARRAAAARTARPAAASRVLTPPRPCGASAHAAALRSRARAEPRDARRESGA